MKFHPLADLFPLIEGDEFTELAESIKAHGLRDPITLFDNAILDGRNRYRACLKAGVDPRFEEFTGDDPHAFVADRNLHRRHLKEGQRAMIAARMATLKKGQRLDFTIKKQDAEISASVPITVDKAADLLKINKTSVTWAKKVLDEGTTEEIAAVDAGKAAPSTIGKQILAGIPPNERDLSGRNSARVKESQIKNRTKAQMKGQVWKQLRAGIEALSSLPQPADVVPLARHMDKIGLLDSRLETTLNWLKEFNDEWNNGNG